MLNRLTTLLAVAAVGAAVLAPGAFTPAHVAGSTQEFIPQSFDLMFEFTPTGETEPIFSEHDTSAHAKPHGNLVTCAFDVADVDDEGTFTIVGTATGFFTPAKKK